MIDYTNEMLETIGVSYEYMEPKPSARASVDLSKGNFDLFLAALWKADRAEQFVYSPIIEQRHIRLHYWADRPPVALDQARVLMLTQGRETFSEVVVSRSA